MIGVDARGDRELKFYRDQNSGFHCFVPTFFGEASVSEADTFVPHDQAYWASKYNIPPVNIMVTGHRFPLTNFFILITKDNVENPIIFSTLTCIESLYYCSIRIFFPSQFCTSSNAESELFIQIPSCKLFKQFLFRPNNFPTVLFYQTNFLMSILNSVCFFAWRMCWPLFKAASASVISSSVEGHMAPMPLLKR